MTHRDVGLEARSRRRGATLAITTIVIMLAVVFATMMATNAFVELNLVNHASDRQSALNLADSIASASIAQLFGNATLGQTQNVIMTVKGPGGNGYASVRFNQGGTDALSGYYVPVSINNLAIDDPSAVPRPGWKRTVAVGCADVVSESNYGSCHVDTEQMLKHCGLFYSVGSAGAVSLDGVQIFSVPSTAAVTRDANGNIVVDLSQQQPSDLVANDVSSDNPAVKLLNGTTISGDVEAVGPVYLKNSTVAGQIEDRTSPVVLPKLSYSSLAAPFLPYSTPINSYFPGDAQVDTIVTASHGLTVGGTLQLQDAVVLVDGDLKVTKGIEGHGAVLVSGSVDVVGSATIAADTQMALLSDGDIRIQGAGMDQSALTGLMYAGGTIQARHVSLFGWAIAAGRSTTNIVDARVVSVPVDFSLTVTAPLQSFGSIGSCTYMAGMGPRTSQLIATYKGDPYQSLWNPQTHTWRTPSPNDLSYSFQPSLPNQPPNPLNVTQLYALFASQGMAGPQYTMDPLGHGMGATGNINDNIQQGIMQLNAWLSLLPMGIPRTRVPHTVSIDINQFVGLEDTTQIVLWRQQTAFTP